MRHLVVNLALAAVWWLAGPLDGTGGFLSGWLLGFALLALARKPLGAQDYVRRSLALAKFAVIFLVEFLRANFTVTRTVVTLSRRLLNPDFVEYDTSDLTRREKLLVAYFVTLSPGTVAAKLSDDGRTLILHALDASDPDELRRWVDRHLKERLLRFTR